VTKIGHDECVAVSSNRGSLYPQTSLWHFEELKILSRKNQPELLFDIHRENYYQRIFIFVGHDEMVTQVSTHEAIAAALQV